MFVDSKDKLDAAFDLVDVDHSQSVSFQEFAKWMVKEIDKFDEFFKSFVCREVRSKRPPMCVKAVRGVCTAAAANMRWRVKRCCMHLLHSVSPLYFCNTLRMYLLHDSLMSPRTRPPASTASNSGNRRVSDATPKTSTPKGKPAARKMSFAAAGGSPSALTRQQSLQDKVPRAAAASLRMRANCCSCSLLQAVAGVNSIKTFARQSTDIIVNVNRDVVMRPLHAPRNAVCRQLQSWFRKTCWGAAKC